MSKLKGAQILVECLKREGVQVAFGIPGGVNLPTFDALYDSGIPVILTAHEQGAAHMADGYARASGRVGVCLATSGPGATNLVTGIATAFMDSIPIVALTGQVRIEQSACGGQLVRAACPTVALDDPAQNPLAEFPLEVRRLPIPG